MDYSREDLKVADDSGNLILRRACVFDAGISIEEARQMGIEKVFALTLEEEFLERLGKPKTKEVTLVREA